MGGSRTSSSCQGRHFQFHEIERALQTVEAVNQPSLEYVVVKPTDSDAPLQVRVELAEGDPGIVAGECAAAIEARVGVKADVEILDRETLDRSGYKQTRLVDA